MFTPTSLTVKAGSTVTWANMDDEPHTVVSDTGLFRSGAVDTDESFLVQIRQARHVPLHLLDPSAHGRNDRGRVAPMTAHCQNGSCCRRHARRHSRSALRCLSARVCTTSAPMTITRSSCWPSSSNCGSAPSPRARARLTVPATGGSRQDWSRRPALCGALRRLSSGAGVTKSDLRPGSIRTRQISRKKTPRDAQRAFWTIKHGIKMSAMPAWGKTLDDAAIWDLVAFIRQMPAITPETSQQLSKPHSG